MKEKKWTKGPWKACMSPAAKADEWEIGGDGWGLATVAPLLRAGGWSEGEANAALMSAAPDLVEALEDLIGLAEIAMGEANNDGGEYDIEGELEDARAAIGKAYGDQS